MRDNRNRLLELIEEGLVDPNYVIMAFVKWNTSDDIEDMCHANEIYLWDDDEDYEHTWSHGLDRNCAMDS
jgi:hypothetical protein